jgi:type IV secretory pathway VirB2 component (pilin)
MRRPVFAFRRNPAQRGRAVHVAYVAVLLLLLPIAAHASPFDSGISSIQTLFTGTIAKAGALIAIVIGGWGFAFGDPGAKKNLAGVAMGSGIAVMAANVLTRLWGT